MNIESISINYSQKFNLGNYESVEISIFLHAKTEPNEPVDGVGEFIIEKAKETVYEQAKKVTDAHNVTCPSIQKYYMGRKADKLPSHDKLKPIADVVRLNGEMATETLDHADYDDGDDIFLIY